jgi:hypothetical protein
MCDVVVLEDTGCLEAMYQNAALRFDDDDDVLATSSDNNSKKWTDAFQLTIKKVSRRRSKGDKGRCQPSSAQS